MHQRSESRQHLVNSVCIGGPEIAPVTNFVSCRAVENTIEAQVASRCHYQLQKIGLEGDIQVM